MYDKKYIDPKSIFIGADIQSIQVARLRTIPYHYNWTCISYFYDLSESFILEFQDLICWDIISERQSLSDSFIINYFDKLTLENLIHNKDISKNIKNYIRMLA